MTCSCGETADALDSESSPETGGSSNLPMSTMQLDCTIRSTGNAMWLDAGGFQFGFGPIWGKTTEQLNEDLAHMVLSALLKCGYTPA